MKRSIALTAFFILLFAPLSATVYEVGPGKAYTSIGAVAWESLAAGDTVRIYCRATPYAEKILICTGGTVALPITIEGIPDISGNRPVITGDGATTRAALDFYGEDRALIMLGDRILARDGGDNPISFTDGTVIKNIIIQGLELKSARPGYSYSNYEGTVVGYSSNAAAVFIEYGENVTIRDCVVSDCGNGLFSAYTSKNVVIASNYVYGNGVVGNQFVHNIYTESQGILFEYNHLGPLRAGATGNNLKDRSIGTIVRYNWIEGGNRQLDLTNVDDPGYTAEHYDLYVNDPAYPIVYVYGNILYEPTNDGNAQICHFGGDAGGYGSYKTQLYFYNNTVISKRTDYTSLFMLSRNEQSCDCRNNIICVTLSADSLGMLDGPDYSRGHLTLSRNWVRPGWVDTHFTIHTEATIDVAVANVGTTDPGFTDLANADFTLATGSECINVAIANAAAVLPAHDPVREYVLHLGGVDRPDTDDLGAFMFGNVTPGTLQFQAAAFAAAENAGTLIVTVQRLFGSDNAVQARVTSADASATAGSDYTAVNTVLDWADGDAADKTATITLQDDAVYEGDETFTLSLSLVSGDADLGTPHAATATVTEDDAAPAGGVLAFTSSSATIAETAGTLSISVARTMGTTGTVTVTVTSTPGTATEDVDYNAVNTVLTWNGGETGTKTVEVTLIDDGSVEGPETLSLQLGTPTGGAVMISPTTCTITMTDTEDALSKGEEGGCLPGSAGMPFLVWLELCAAVGMAGRLLRSGRAVKP